MDFGALSPEVTSGRMYAGPGSGPLRVAAMAWARIATELAAAAGAYQAVLTGLTDESWFGPASEAMAAAAAPFTGWMNTTAESAGRTAAQAGAAAAAFDEAYAAVVPPAVIAANRAQLATLIAGNVLGQNGTAIAAAEAQYALMWVQDVLAMYGYAAHSAGAAALTPFGEPPETTNPAGSAGPATGAHSRLSQLMAAVPQALHGLAASAAPAAPPVPSADTLSLAQLASYVQLVPKSIVPFNDAIKTILYAMVQFSRNLNTDLDVAAATHGEFGFGSGMPAPPPAAPAVVNSRPVVAVSTGSAGAIGKLTVPSAWAAAAPEVAMTAVSIPGVGAAAVPAAATGIPTGIYGDMALASLAGRAVTGAAPRGRPAAIMNGHAQSRLERLVTELAGTQEVQHWHVDSSRLDSLLEELSEQPGVHAVHVNPDGQNTIEARGEPGPVPPIQRPAESD